MTGESIYTGVIIACDTVTVYMNNSFHSYACINIPEKEQKGVGLFIVSNRLRELQNRALRSEMEIIAITAAYITMVRKQNVYGVKIGIEKSAHLRCM